MPESAREWIKANYDKSGWDVGRAIELLLLKMHDDRNQQDALELVLNTYASSRVAALEQRIAEAIAILDQAGDNRDAALAKLQEVKA